MAAIYLNDDNSLKYTAKSVIMQRSTTERLRILIPRMYKVTSCNIIDGEKSDYIDMKDATVYLHYVTPISREHRIVMLYLENDNYTSQSEAKNKVLSYCIPLTSEYTSERGKLEMWLTIAASDAIINQTDDFKLEQLVRRSGVVYIPITPVSDYDNVYSDDTLEAFDSKVAYIESLVKQLEAQAGNIDYDLSVTSSDGRLHITKDDEAIGDGVNVSQPTVEDEDDGTQDGIIDLTSIYNP